MIEIFMNYVWNSVKSCSFPENINYLAKTFTLKWKIMSVCVCSSFIFRDGMPSLGSFAVPLSASHLINYDIVFYFYPRQTSTACIPLSAFPLKKKKFPLLKNE